MVILAPGSKYLTAGKKGFASERAHSLLTQCFMGQRPRAVARQDNRGEEGSLGQTDASRSALAAQTGPGAGVHSSDRALAS